MLTGNLLTSVSLAVLALGSSTAFVETAGSGTANAQAGASISASLYRADVPNPLDPPGCWGADGIWYPDCWGPGMGPGMMGPGQWGPGMGPGMMDQRPWDN